MKRIVATIEARMTSSRLPGKVLMEAAGMPMLEILIKRLRKINKLHEIVLATTVNEADNVIIDLAKRLQVFYFRGSEEDVLSRVLGAAKKNRADIIVEITGDCPLVDPDIVAQAIKLYLTGKYDYVSNVEPVTFPVGMDVQVFSTELLELADREGEMPEHREHVSWFIRKKPRRFRHKNLTAPSHLYWSELGLTLDEHKDFLLLKNIVEHFHPNLYFSCRQIIDYLKANPKLLELNKDVVRRDG